MQQAVQIWVTGRVQGVSYRYHTMLMAEKLGVRGWVRNLPDGRVEMWVEGESTQVQAMEQWCWQGSPLAKVETVQTQSATPQHYPQFSLRR